MSMLVFNCCIMVFSPLFWCHNAYSYNSEQKALIISLLMTHKLIITQQTLTVNAEVASWWKWRAKSDSSSLPSMMFEDNVGEDGLSAQSSYTIDINDSNYIDNLATHPTNFYNKAPLVEDTFKKVYTQMISALNDVRIHKSTNSTLFYNLEWKIFKYFYWLSEGQCCCRQK
jgi:hypothetical protein